MFTDTHCHLFKEYYSDISNIINESQKNDVGKLICASTSLSDIEEVINLANTYDFVYACIGIHPDAYLDDLSKFETILINNLNNKKVVGIGEIGLDYYYTKENREKQIEVFEFQLKLAEKYNLPVVIHSREATLDTINSLKKYKVKGLLHSYTGSIETANILIKMGFYFGVNGIITFKNSKVDEVIAKIPMERLVLETDSPYLTPEPFRGKQNTPKYIPIIASKLAKIKNISVLEVLKITDKNVHDIFDK